ncbi:oligopeptide/dipeptide ABC transporter ATP-binding protein [Shigella flexneri]
MYAGQVVETGDARAIFHAPRHPYTQALLRALPRICSGQRTFGVVTWRRSRQVRPPERLPA